MVPELSGAPWNDTSRFHRDLRLFEDNFHGMVTQQGHRWSVWTHYWVSWHVAAWLAKNFEATVQFNPQLSCTHVTRMGLRSLNSSNKSIFLTSGRGNELALQQEGFSTVNNGTNPPTPEPMWKGLRPNEAQRDWWRGETGEWFENPGRWGQAAKSGISAGLCLFPGVDFAHKGPCQEPPSSVQGTESELSWEAQPWGHHICGC